ncbi:hypothetical protein HXX76_005628 [Chlamydomonas incerta]|uniref:Protein kinase domain-containing protein n=1 Tax=Chlamydomonas incerta TaxID=51695 RepID=A0A835W5L9_CHLIN|nr:hypothetical protein HXX76_005628 [Chlamydomonas incerta]|eukprot:KAG2438014.1 hypothetical protein HXX76_005628 [Chlamydomonas incerta]
MISSGRCAWASRRRASAGASTSGRRGSASASASASYGTGTRVVVQDEYGNFVEMDIGDLFGSGFIVDDEDDSDDDDGFLDLDDDDDLDYVVWASTPGNFTSSFQASWQSNGRKPRRAKQQAAAEAPLSMDEKELLLRELPRQYRAAAQQMFGARLQTLRNLDELAQLIEAVDEINSMGVQFEVMHDEFGKGVGSSGSSSGRRRTGGGGGGRRTSGGRGGAGRSSARSGGALVLTDDDFSLQRLPIPVLRNFTIEGAWQQSLGRRPYVDWAYTRAKVRLGPGVTLTLDKVLSRRSRSDPSFRAPGFDLVTDDSGRDADDPAAFAVIIVNNTVNLQDCAGSSSTDLPYEQQCILSSGGVYIDLGLYCYSLDVYGNQVKTGYVSAVLNSENQCYQYMTVECTKQYGGVVGCYNYMITQQQQQQQAHSPPPLPPPPAGGAAGSSALWEIPAAAGNASDGGGTGGSSSSGDTQAVIIGSVVGGVVGGLLIAASITWTTVALMRRRRRRLATCGASSSSSNPAKAADGTAGCYDQSEAAATSPNTSMAAAALAANAGVFWSLVPVTPLTPFQPHILLNVTPVPAQKATAAASLAPTSRQLRQPVTASRPPRPPSGSTSLASLSHEFGSGNNAFEKITAAAASNGGVGKVTTAAGSEVAAANCSSVDTHASLTTKGNGGAAAVYTDLHVVLTDVVIGKGAFGKVVEGLYRGRRVAVKQIDMGLLLLQPPCSATAVLNGDTPPPNSQQQQQPAQRPPLLASSAALYPPRTATFAAPEAAAVAAAAGGTAAAVDLGALPRQLLLIPQSATEAQQLSLLYAQPLMTATASTGALLVAASDGGYCSNSADPQQQQGPQQTGAAPAAAGGAQPGQANRKIQDALIATLEQEVQVLARVQHPNIITLLAANLVPPNVCLVMELMDTSLDRLLYKDPSRPLPLSLAVHIALQVARALEYLHPTIIHRDLKDFGLSRLRSSTLITQEPGVGTGPYMAPECFDVNNIAITDRADCYAFGVLLWELIARSQPWAGLSVVAMAVRVVVNGERLPMSPLALAGAPAKLQKLVTQCFDADPRRRPAAADIVKVLLLLQQQLVTGVYDSSY